MVYGFVRQSEGWITVQSEVGFGTSFGVYLPWIEAAAPAGSSRTPVVEALGGGETVLLVEDQPAVRSFLREVLKEYGYRVIEASGGEEAIAFAGRYEGHIHLLLTDIVLTGMNGRIVSEQLQASRPDLKILFMSGYPADVISQRGVLDPGAAFLKKPFDPDDLAAKVRQLLDDRNDR